MKAARLVGPKQFEFVDAEIPSVRPGELLVRLEKLSICGSDLRTYDRTFPEEEYPLRLGAPCHECAGVIEESLDDRFHKGQRVIALLGGGLMEYAAVPASEAVLIPENAGDPDLWVLCQPVGTVIYACQKMGSVAGKRVVILGQGPIGLAFTDLLSKSGARQVIVSDKHDYRLDIARKLGATHTINPTRDNVAEAVRDITGGAMADVSVEATGRPECCAEAFEVLRMEGLSVVFGMTHDVDVFPFDWGAMYNKLPQIIVTNSARAGNRAGVVAAAVDLVAQGRLDLTPYLSHRMPWTEVGKAYDLYSNKLENSLKVVMNVP
jgi:threonine dehydrogenase-like Zn-dependent dehydrogenase